jgi:hypothetical protein
LRLFPFGSYVLLYDEVNESLPADVPTSHEIDDLLSLLERQGIEVYEDPPPKAALT